MKVGEISLRDFRNIREASFTPDPKLNFLVGSNGQGKTSILEALGFLSTLRSFRGSKSTEVIRFGCSSSEIFCEILPDFSPGESGLDWKAQLKVIFEIQDQERRKAIKTAFINGKAYRSSTQFLSQRFGNYELGFHSIVFNPSDHDLVRSEPAIRRSYLDRVLSAEDIRYLDWTLKYQRLLEQRNALLKSLETPAPDLLLGFTEPLSELAARITQTRLEWLKRLADRLDGVARRIAPDQPVLRLFYLSNWGSPIDGLCIPNNNLGRVHFAGLGPLPSLELLRQAFWKRLSSLETAEWKSRSTLVGPHRDDWAFFQGDQVLKGHGSQGEIRSALLALKLCEVELFREKTGHRPIFLLDDFSSELDQKRRSFLLRFLSETDLQVFVTTTDETFLGNTTENTGRRFRVTDGSLEEIGNETSNDHRERDDKQIPDPER